MQGLDSTYTSSVAPGSKTPFMGIVQHLFLQVAGTPPPPPSSVPEGNFYFQQSSQAELTISKYKGATANADVERKMEPKLGIIYPYNREYIFQKILCWITRMIYLWTRRPLFQRG